MCHIDLSAEDKPLKIGSRRTTSCLAVAVLLLAGCQGTSGDPATTAPSQLNEMSRVAVSPYGTTADGRTVRQYRLTNANGASVDVIEFGGAVTAINMPDKHGKLANVALHYPDLATYELPGGPYLGATIGRYGNRIANATFDLEGKTYPLAANNGPNNLHGGPDGFDKRMWDATPVAGKSAVRLHRVSPDGEEGFPSDLDVTITITLTDHNTLSFDYLAKNTGDKATVLSLTNHTYFNLAGEGNGDILGDVVTLNADKYLPTDDVQIPTGEQRPVNGTPFDFTTPHAIGERIGQTDGGYDHNFIINGKPGTLREAAKVVDPDSGRVMVCRTTEPGVQFYTGNSLNGTPSHGGYQKNAGLCLETQHYPDSPNQPDFPSTTLKPGHTYESTTVYEFTTQK